MQTLAQLVAEVEVNATYSIACTRLQLALQVAREPFSSSSGKTTSAELPSPRTPLRRVPKCMSSIPKPKSKVWSSQEPKSPSSTPPKWTRPMHPGLAARKQAQKEKEKREAEERRKEEEAAKWKWRQRAIQLRRNVEEERKKREQERQKELAQIKTANREMNEQRKRRAKVEKDFREKEKDRIAQYKKRAEEEKQKQREVRKAEEIPKMFETDHFETVFVQLEELRLKEQERLEKEKFEARRRHVKQQLVKRGNSLRELSPMHLGSPKRLSSFPNSPRQAAVRHLYTPCLKEQNN